MGVSPGPCVQAAAWLQQRLHDRISSDLYLILDSTSNLWHLTCSGADGTITMPLIPALYRLGSNPELPCCRFEVANGGFDAIEPALPAPGRSERSQSLLTQSEAGLHLHYDIPGLTYWMLARCEEVNPPAELLDHHLRFAATSSHAFRHGYLERPIVDEWLGILRQVISRLWPRLPLVQSQFKVVVSHDVDAPSAYCFLHKRSLARAMAVDLLKRRDPGKVVSASWIRLRTKDHLHPRDPFNTFDWLMDTSEAAGIHSSFYFICGRTDPRRDAQYEPEHPAIRDLMRRIHQRGHFIGLHPSYNTCGYPERIVSEAQRLQRICADEGINQLHWGGRMHYLRWQWPTTAYGWEQAGFHYDSTLSYADRPGFRCGTCHPYQMFDPVARRPLRLIQRPLIAMECSVIESSYLGLGYSSASVGLFQRLKHRCQAVGGQFALLWHNSRLGHIHAKSLYSQVVNYERES